MDVGFSAWLFVIAVATSALGGSLGMASGIFIVPVLVSFGGVGIRTAVAASIVSVIACSCGSAAAFLRAGLTNIRVAIVLETATTLGALSGVFLGGVLPPSFLFLLFALILLLSARQMMARRRESVPTVVLEEADSSDWATVLGLHSSYPDSALRHDVPYRVHRVPLGLALMYGAGLISALLGIGSGVLKIPAMDTALRLPIKVSSATSNFMIGVTAAASGVAYFVLGDIDPNVAGPVAIGSVIGAVLGARFLMAMTGDKLRLFFVIVLLALAVQMLLEAFGVHLGRRAP